jgi:4-amino-4-deoxy-L-arabinose transferase-like glycosyltransferase
VGEWLRFNSNPSSAKRTLFVMLLILGFGLRMGYGVLRYRSSLIHLSGDGFISSWDHDARYHVLIAKALLSGQGYVVYDSPGAKPIRYAGQPALFKAPLYQYFLAQIFAISGFSFKLFFPLQALLGGLMAGFVGLISLRVFQKPEAAWMAGIAAGGHPILVNSASQPYNENLFFFLFVVSIWAFLVWLETLRVRWALLTGIAVGLCMLTRENGSLLLIAMGLVLLLRTSLALRTWLGYALIAAMSVAVVAPWTIRNFVRFRAFVPVASIVGVDFAEGNNECVASEGVLVSYWAEGPCPRLDQQLRTVLASEHFDPRTPDAVRVDQAYKRIALRFVKDHPLAYAKLALRRLWTSLLPYDPRGSQGRQERLVLVLYWLIVFPAGTMAMILALKTSIETGRLLLALVIVLNLASMMAVLYWSDLRFRVGIDLLLGCFAGWGYCQFFSTTRPRRQNLETEVPAKVL